MSDQTDNRPASDLPVQGCDSPVSWQDALAEAYAEAKTLHPADFDLLQPVMLRVAEAFHPQWDKILLSEFVEGLYVIARYANFTAEVRDQLLLSKATVPEHRM